jgi:hypothetical protein
VLLPLVAGIARSRPQCMRGADVRGERVLSLDCG